MLFVHRLENCPDVWEDRFVLRFLWFVQVYGPGWQSANIKSKPSYSFYNFRIFISFIYTVILSSFGITILPLTSFSSIPVCSCMFSSLESTEVGVITSSDLSSFDIPNWNNVRLPIFAFTNVSAFFVFGLQICVYIPSLQLTKEIYHLYL